MKVFSIFAASVFAAVLALSSAAVAAEDMSSQSMGSQTESSSQSMGAQDAGTQSQSQGMAASDPQQVREIQQALKEKGYKTGAVDGIMGPKTASALRQFQRDQGIQTSGQVDTQTLQALGVTQTGGAQEQFGVSPEFSGEQGTQSEQSLPVDQAQDPAATDVPPSDAGSGGMSGSEGTSGSGSIPPSGSGSSSQGM